MHVVEENIRLFLEDAYFSGLFFCNAAGRNVGYDVVLEGKAHVRQVLMVRHR